ncbi:MAG: helix-turn-helix transcriptional regulator [Clostridia bacterium]|nr:helix-turn-helix transcriptional regulator [Clostridia bacterium]
MPAYSSIYASLRQTTIEKNNSIIQQEISKMENEINLQINVVKNITSGKDFKILSNPPAYGYSVSGAEWFESRESVRKSFSYLKSIVSLQDKSFLLFRNSDTQIDTNGSIDDFRSSYDTLWRLTVEGENCLPDAAASQLFKKHSGHFNGSIGYNDMTRGKNYELVYLLTLSSVDEEMGNDSVFVACYDAEKIIERLGFNDDISSVLIVDADEEKLYSQGREYEVSKYDSCYESENLNIKVYYIISDSCMNKQMEPVNTFFAMAFILFVIFGVIITVGAAFIERKNIDNLVKSTEGLGDIGVSENDDYSKYLEKIIEKAGKNNVNVQEVKRKMIFTKMLSFKLTDEELKEVEKYFSSLVCVLILKKSDAKYNTMDSDVYTYLKSNNSEPLHTLSINNSESVFFIRMSAVIKDILDDMIVFVNKEKHTDIRGICAVCDSVKSIPAIYEKIRRDINFLEYGTLKFIKNFEDNSTSNEYKNIISKSRQLYEIIKSGNEFEAKRMVYELWYKVTQEEIDTENIGTLYFSQTSILLQIIAENNLKIAVPKFNSGKDVVSIAFEITECIEQICQSMKSSGKKEDVRISQIIDYINQRYCDSSFYMPELVGKFELSDRAIVQMLKKATGDNFSNYLGKLRIAKAKEILETTNTPISAVASASGFDSSNSLYKAFKKVYGVSPSMYRGNRKNEQQVD